MTALDYAPDITDENFAEVYALDGRPLRIEPYNTEASIDVLRHYAHGIGDDNPLFSDPDHGARSPFGTNIAPPTFLYSVFDGAIGAGLPGVQPIYAGTEWTFYRSVRRGEAIVPVGHFGPARRLSGSRARDMVIQTADTSYLVDGVPVARALASTFRVPRRGAKDGLAYEPRAEYRYTAEEIERIRFDACHEFRRGATPLDFASLRVGAEVPAVVKGPIDQITMTAYYAGCIGSPGYKACELAWKYRDFAENEPLRLPSNYDPSYFAETVLPSLGHQNPSVAKEIGMPGAYDNGPQRCGWFAHAVTNWMGDSALLHTLSVRLRRPDIFGDTLWIGGTVRGLRKAGDYGLVDLDLTAVNQLDDGVATGTATVVVRLDASPEPIALEPGTVL
ncbi:FAS1-like dehydratase domain-containing protein [Actinophytocola sp.]|uniref:FAS1-like dehydratase domain-containing protein n=1 Tax=Actinophytocola sp. TaxID=1872138 RepID=UPI003D6B4624